MSYVKMRVGLMNGGETSHVCAAPDDEEEVSDNKTI